MAHAFKKYGVANYSARHRVAVMDGEVYLKKWEPLGGIDGVTSRVSRSTFCQSLKAYPRRPPSSPRRQAVIVSHGGAFREAPKSEIDSITNRLSKPTTAFTRRQQAILATCRPSTTPTKRTGSSLPSQLRSHSYNKPRSIRFGDERRSEKDDYYRKGPTSLDSTAESQDDDNDYDRDAYDENDDDDEGYDYNDDFDSVVSEDVYSSDDSNRSGSADQGVLQEEEHGRPESAMSERSTTSSRTARSSGSDSTIVLSRGSSLDSDNISRGRVKRRKTRRDRVSPEFSDDSDTEVEDDRPKSGARRSQKPLSIASRQDQSPSDDEMRSAKNLLHDLDRPNSNLNQSSLATSEYGARSPGADPEQDEERTDINSDNEPRNLNDSTASHNPDDFVNENQSDVKERPNNRNEIEDVFDRDCTLANLDENEQRLANESERFRLASRASSAGSRAPVDDNTKRSVSKASLQTTSSKDEIRPSSRASAGTEKSKRDTVSRNETVTSRPSSRNSLGSQKDDVDFQYDDVSRNSVSTNGNTQRPQSRASNMSTDKRPPSRGSRISVTSQASVASTQKGSVVSVRSSVVQKNPSSQNRSRTPSAISKRSVASSYSRKSPTPSATSKRSVTSSAADKSRKSSVVSVRSAGKSGHSGDDRSRASSRASVTSRGSAQEQARAREARAGLLRVILDQDRSAHGSMSSLRTDDQYQSDLEDDLENVSTTHAQGGRKTTSPQKSIKGGT